MRSQPTPCIAPVLPHWQQELARAITSIEELAATLSLSPDTLRTGREAAANFSLRVPRGFVRRMRAGDPHDPLLLQVLPSARELVERSGFIGDPLDEHAQVTTRGLMRKYRGRALLITTGACAVNCRYCFRREFPYTDMSLSAAATEAAIDAIAGDPTLEEVILSGGDPLTLGDARLGRLLAPLGRIAHLRRIRIHTRVPVVLPERVDTGLIAVLRAADRPVVMVLHANHARELDDQVAAALKPLTAAGVTLLNQSVLLRGINDDEAVLAALSERLFSIGVLPYYLHLLDPIRGAEHFDVDEARARHIVAELAARLPGYLVPRLVRERAGADSKQIISPMRHNRTHAD